MLRVVRGCRSAAFAASWLLVMAPTPATADDAREFADFMIEAVTPKPGFGSMAPVSAEAMQDLDTLAQRVFEVPHPPAVEDLEATVRAVLDPAVNSRSGRAPDWRNSQKQLVDAILKLVGHGAFRIDDSQHFATPRKSAVALTASARMRRSWWMVRLPELDITDGSPAGCRDLRGLLNIPSTARGVILDLRETRGGDLFAVTCIANVFVAHGTLLFKATRKPGETISFNSSAKIGRDPIDLPLVVLIDRSTDRRPLLLATVLRDLGRAKLIGERPVQFDASVLEEFRFSAFGEWLRRDKDDREGAWLPMRIVMPVGEFSLPSGYPPDAVLVVDAPVTTRNERELFAFKVRQSVWLWPGCISNEVRRARCAHIVLIFARRFTSGRNGRTGQDARPRWVVHL